VQTGLTGPHFNGYYFSIIEGGYGWTAPKPGIAAIGGWYQRWTSRSGNAKRKGDRGIYAFGSQALWIKESQTTNKGNVSGFFQLGWNHSKTLPMNLYAGAGLTAFALVPKRPNDSFGAGCGLVAS
jgi:porin